MIGLHNNEQIDVRENMTLTRMRDDGLTVVQLHAIEPGYCLDAPDFLPAGGCEGFTPRTKTGLLAKRPSRNFPYALWSHRA